MTKIPIMDECIRSLQSLGDAVRGDRAAARRRWENYYSDSLLGTALKTGSLGLALGASIMAGDSDKAAKFSEQASESGQKLTATAYSSMSHLGGLAAQASTLGIPNPVSAALNGIASGANRVIDEDATRGTNGISWRAFIEESTIGAAKGAASSGGIIPYTGTAVEKSLRGQEIEFDHEQEWSNWGINATLSLATAGTVKGTAAMAKAGKIGVKKAMALGGSVGAGMGSTAASISQEVQSAALERKMKKKGYKYNRKEQLDDGREYAVYTKTGMPDFYAPKPDPGDTTAQGVVHGVMTAAAVEFEVKNN